MTLLGPVLAALGLCGGLANPASAGAVVLHYRGAAVSVPGGWPVYDLARHPGLCVRFDRPAVYLGRPAAHQACAAGAIAGRPQAILIEPQGRGVVVVRRAADTIGLPRSAAAQRARSAAGPRAGSAAATYTGLGFDACSAPSAATMSHWHSSPYRAIGVYIGGTNMACAQPNLTPTWVSQQTAAGWHFILTYVGLQAPGNSCGCAGIAPAQAAGQGQAAASDAASRAGALGLGPGNPIYFDMEAYPRTSANTSAVMAFLAAWTKRLHALGYKSGVYSSGGSGIGDLVDRYGSSYAEPDDIWFAEWNGSRSTDSAYIPSGDWAGHRRLHQYAGDHNERFGGVTLNIDSDSLDGLTATAGRTTLIADGTFIQLTSTGQTFRMAGGAPLYINDPGSVAGAQSGPYTKVSPQQFASLNPVPLDGTYLQTASGQLYRVAGGTPFAISQPSLFPQAGTIQVDSWDLTNLGDPLSHLNPTPADGTAVQGLPSGAYWVFSGGDRTRAAATPAVAVDDAGLAPFPLAQCLVPKLGRLTLGQARAAIQQTNCRLGRVTRRRQPRPGHPLHVLRQFPGANARRAPFARVAVTLG